MKEGCAMQYGHTDRRRMGPALLGGLLVVAGLGAFALQTSGVELGELIGQHGWPFFVIVPGLALLGATALVEPPRGVGFAVSGAIVTTVGGILLYQNATETWDTWAFAWALIPTAAGVATAVYGLLVDAPDQVTAGSRVAVIGAVLFIAGMWFFSPILDTGRPPIELGDWWPLVLVAIGAVIIVSTILGGGSDEHTPTTPTAGSQS
jgi:hypothetical protein